MIAPDVASNLSQSARLLLKELQGKFEVFRNCKPLAIGIDKQIIAQLPDLNRKVLRAALGMHTNSFQYLKGMEKATVRYDLEGNTADEIAPPHRARATEILRERAKKKADVSKAQREAEIAQRKAEEAEEAAKQHAEKLNQLSAKFARPRN